MYSASITTGDWESYIADDLVAYIDSNYRTIASRESRGLSGHSMGGYGTLRIGMKRPDAYAVLYQMAACCLMNGQGGGRGRGGGVRPEQAEETQAGRGGRGRGRGGFNTAGAQSAAWAPNPFNPPDYSDPLTLDGEVQPEIAALFHANSPLVTETIEMPELVPLTPIFDNPAAFIQTDKATTSWFGTDSGFEVFLLNGRYQDYIFSGELQFEGEGKCGLVLHLDEAGDGYYLSLDLYKGVAQLRAWGHRGGEITEEAFDYEQLQAAHYIPSEHKVHSFQLIAYEQYLEFSFNGVVLLTLSDETFRKGHLGFYVESGKMRVENLSLQLCQPPETRSYPEEIPNY
jgi:pimeloyl-ACP methyl ester carboxylesterase